MSVWYVTETTVTYFSVLGQELRSNSDKQNITCDSTCHMTVRLAFILTYPLSPNEQSELDEFLQENLKSGCIRPSKSPMASPVFFIKKKDGSLQLVQDYQELIPNSFHPRAHKPALQCKVFHQTGCSMGVQQCSDLRGR